MTAPVPDRRTGGAAFAGGLLLAASVGAELLHPVQAADGTVLQDVPFAGYLVAWIAGAALLVRAAAGLSGSSRAGRTGRALSLTGLGLLLLFSVVVLVTGLLGRPPEASFLAFAIALLLCAAGSLVTGIVGRRPLLVLAGVGALGALLAPGDPWHDLGLLAFCLGWAAEGAVGSPARDRAAVAG